jgi:hypothetical protein
MPEQVNDFDPKSIIKSRSTFGPMVIRTPIPFADGIVAATVMGVINTPLTLTLRPSGTALTYMTGTLGQMMWPIVPVCTCADQTSLYKLDIEGWDQFGDGKNGPGGQPFTETGTKSSATELITRFDFRAYSRIKSIVVTPLNAAAAADSISIGFQWDLAGGTPPSLTRLPLPFKSRKQIVTSGPTTFLGDWAPHVYPLGVTGTVLGGLGAAAFGAMLANVFTVVNTANGNYQGVGGVSLGANSSSEKSVIAVNVNWDGVAVQTQGIDLLVWIRDASSDLTI